MLWLTADEVAWTFGQRWAQLTCSLRSNARYRLRASLITTEVANVVCQNCSRLHRSLDRSGEANRLREGGLSSLRDELSDRTDFLLTRNRD